MDPDVASTRLSRYEAGISEPSFHVAAHLGRALGVPMAYFYAEDDQLAWLIRVFQELSHAQRTKLARLLEEKRL